MAVDLDNLVRTPDGDLVHPDTITPGGPIHSARCNGTGWAIDDSTLAVACQACRPHLRPPTPRRAAPYGWRDRR
jgi:hypothetical protein